MHDVPGCHAALVVGLVLMAGCAGIERVPPQRPPAATAAEAVVAVAPRVVAATTPAASAPSSIGEGEVRAPARVVRPVEPAQTAPTRGNLAQTAVTPPPAAAKRPASPPPAAPPAPAPSPALPPVKAQTPAPPPVKPAGPPPLDLKTLETRLKATKAIGVFSKLALKNQIDDLLERFRAFYQDRIKTSLVELRRSFDLLVMKTLALLQDDDPSLADALASSRESIWGILSDRAKFAAL